MSRVDWTAIEAQLNETRATTAQELEDIDAVLETVRARGASTPAPKSKAAPAHKNGRAQAKPATNGKAKARVGLTDDQRATLRGQWTSGTDAKVIAARLKISTALLYYYVKTNGWKRPEKTKAARPNPGVAALPAAATPVSPAGTQLSGSVKCTDPECGAWTDHDPCRTCGKKLKRKGW